MIIEVGDRVVVTTLDWDRLEDTYDGGIGTVVEVDPNSDYPVKVKFDNAYSPKSKQDGGRWIWKEFPIRRY